MTAVRGQAWFCEVCEAKGTVCDAGSVFEVVHRISDDHCAKSPSCVNGYRQLRVIRSNQLNYLEAEQCTD